jgi:hypothetical protein
VSRSSIKALQELVKQMDTLFPTLNGKEAANLLIEKASIIRQQIEMEDTAEERKAGALAAGQAEKITALEQKSSASAAKITELEQQNRELQAKASTPRIECIPDPNHATVKEERDALHGIVTLIAATLAEDARAEAAVRVIQSCSNPAAVDTFCRLVKIDYGALVDYATYTESALRGLQSARDSNGIIVRAVLAVKYPAPVKPQAPVVVVPDLRSADEKLRDAKASVRSGL